MSSLLLPRRFYNQPQGAIELNRSNNFVGRGILLAFNGAEASGTPTGTISRIATTNGVATLFGSSASVLSYPMSDAGWLGALTVITRFSNGSSNSRVLNKWDAVENRNSPIDVSLYSSVNGVYVQRNNATHNNTFKPSSAISTYSVAHKNLAITVAENVQSVPSFYDNGVYVSGAIAFTATGTGASTGTNAPVRLGNWDSGSTLSIDYLYVFPYVMNQSEIINIHANPWQIFRVSE